MRIAATRRLNLILYKKKSFNLYAEKWFEFLNFNLVSMLVVISKSFANFVAALASETNRVGYSSSQGPGLLLLTYRYQKLTGSPPSYNTYL